MVVYKYSIFALQTSTDGLTVYSCVFLITNQSKGKKKERRFNAKTSIKLPKQKQKQIKANKNHPLK